MGKNVMVEVGILAVFLVAHITAHEPTDESASPQVRSRRHYRSQNPFYSPSSQYDIFFGQSPISVPTQSGIYNAAPAPQSPVIGYAGQPYPGYHSEVPINPETCGDRFDGVCQQSRYRTIDGSCNNPYHPTWGQANTRYGRLLPANYADGVHEPTRAKSGNPLPLSRLASLVLFPDVPVEDKRFTLGTMQWGQIISHDMARLDDPAPQACCSADGQFTPAAFNSPSCFPIALPKDDPIRLASGARCMNFTRATTDLDRGCSTKYEPAEQLNFVTSFLDLSLSYGSSRQTLSSLRAGFGGRLVVDVRNGREFPPTAFNKTDACPLQRQTEICYRSGDRRVNQNPQHTLLQIVLHREHNRIANALAKLNPHWNDETLFQEARRIAIAESQYITYYEWLPLLLGTENLLCHKIIYDTPGYVDDYSPSVNPGTLNDHSTGAFRYFHTAIAGRLHLVDEYRRSHNSFLLGDVSGKPAVLEVDDNFNDLARGLATEHELELDQFLDSQITQFLFRGNDTFGIDLKAFDIQRGRDHGLASYNEYRQYCGLPKARTWADFTDHISPENVETLAKLYESPDDVDLNVGAPLETFTSPGFASPTFLCILYEQFYRTRAGDRFWFETSNPEVAFTPEQLHEIRRSSFAKLLCNNADGVKLMQPRGFEILSEHNQLVPCDQLPDVDLSFWKAVDPRYEQSPYNTPTHYRS